jgi:thiosulfate/3-mercaptopyruvate sulfurtransferase
MTTFTNLVSTKELRGHLCAWRIFDCRYNAMEPGLGEQQYAQSHIEGALFVSLDSDLCGVKTGANGRHPLPERHAFVSWLGTVGIRPGDQVVCYDDSTGAVAARLWWMLRWAGHDAVCVLEGGFDKWIREGHPVTAEVRQFDPTHYAQREGLQGTVNLAEVERMPTRDCLIDARAPARYRGEQEPIDPAAGHIPGAMNRFNMDNLRPDGSFKDAATLRSEWQRIADGHAPGDLVHYCGSGVSACHNLLAMEVAGLPGGSLYVGSWSEWSADARRPRAPQKG